MRMIKANPQPIGGEKDGRWLLPNPKADWGGLWFSYPCPRIETGEHIPCKGRLFDGSLCPETGMELVRIDNVWYWVE